MVKGSCFKRALTSQAGKYYIRITQWETLEAMKFLLDGISNDLTSNITEIFLEGISEIRAENKIKNKDTLFHSLLVYAVYAHRSHDRRNKISQATAHKHKLYTGCYAIQTEQC